MAAATRCPDPYDTAGDPWWRTHDCVEAIAGDAARIAAAARAALVRLRAGHNADLDDLADRLDRWSWTRDALDLTTDHALGHADNNLRVDAGADR